MHIAAGGNAASGLNPSTNIFFPSTYRDAGCNATPGRNASKQYKYWTAGQPEAMASTGIITDFIFKKGFGFITPDDGSDDVFAHISELAHISEGVWVGDAVTYDKEWVERKSKHNATNINVMKRQRTITPNHLPPPSTTGTIKKFPKGMRFGFISPDDGGEDIFVHMTEITAAQASAGDSVSYKVEFDSRKAKFYAVELTASQSSRDSRAGTVGAEPSPAGQSSRDSRAGTDEQGQSSWDSQAGTVQIEQRQSSGDSRAGTQKRKDTRAGAVAKGQSKRDSRGGTVEEGQGQGPGPGPWARRQFWARAWLPGQHMYPYYVSICSHMYPYVREENLLQNMASASRNNTTLVCSSRGHVSGNRFGDAARLNKSMKNIFGFGKGQHLHTYCCKYQNRCTAAAMIHRV